MRARTPTGIVELHARRCAPLAIDPLRPGRRWARCVPGAAASAAWPGVRHCHVYTVLLSSRYTVMGIGRYQTRSGDCLTLNVVTPEERPATQPLPVMVLHPRWGLHLGSSATVPTAQRWHAAAACTCRSTTGWGALGCLDLSSCRHHQITLDSNVYLRDLVLALRWVHDGIAEFGEPRAIITIFGESAGAYHRHTCWRCQPPKAYSPEARLRSQRRAWFARVAAGSLPI